MGHHSIFCARTPDEYLGYFLASFVNGISMSWQQHRHNTHHATTNHLEHDPDIQILPIWSVSDQFFSNIYSTYRERVMKFDPFARFLVSMQTITLLPILFLLARSNMHLDSYTHFLEKINSPKYPYRFRLVLEIIAVIGYWVWFGYGLIWCCIPFWWQRVLFYVVTSIASGLYFLQITTSHYAMPTVEVDPDESYPKRMSRTTNNVQCPPWLDWFFGGFHLQIEHHFFPRIPRSNLRRLQPIVENFCRQHGLGYHQHSFWESHSNTMAVLYEVEEKAKKFRFE